MNVQKGDLTIIVLSDGAGSAQESEIGSRITCECTASLALNAFDRWFQQNVRNIVDEVLDNIIGELEKISDNQCQGFASTLLFVICDDEKYIAGHLGDGKIAKFNNGKVVAETSGYRGDFANTTVFTTSANAREKFEVTKGSIEQTTGFALMSDGAADTLFSNDTKEFAHAVSDLINILSKHSPNICLRVLNDLIKTGMQTNTSDDCAVALMAR